METFSEHVLVMFDISNKFGIQRNIETMLSMQKARKVKRKMQ